MTLRILTASLLLALNLITLSHAQAAMKHSVDIPAQPLGSALALLAKQTGIQLIYSTDLAEGRFAAPLKGALTPEEGLAQLLAATPLQFEFVDEQTVMLTLGRSQPGGARTLSSEEGRVQDEESANPSAGADQSLWARFRLAQATQGASTEATSAGRNNEEAAQREAVTLQEVIVSAQKRGEERLQDTPIPMSVLDTAALADNNQLLLRDYAASVPGFGVSPNIEDNQMLAIRGITTGGFSVPTVGVLIDDVPYAAGNEVPDIDPGDLARIEVLRGPQGTLYGANAMGGLINYKTIAPSTDGFSGRVEAGISDVHYGVEPGYNMRAAANLPLSDTLAMRASAFTRQDPGYINNPSLGLTGVNEAQAYGFRLAGLWRPSEEVSLLLSALDQNIKSNGIAEVNKGPGLGDWDQDYVAGLGGFERRTEAYSATFKAKLGSVDFTSVSGYNINRAKEPFDYTPFFGAKTLQLYGVSGTAFFDISDYTKFTQELRLSGSALDRLDWLLGGFYTHEKHQESDVVHATNPVTGQIVAQAWYYNFPSKVEESAAFVDLTYRFTDQFDVQVGGRESHTIVGNYATYALGALRGNVTPAITPPVSSGANTFTYLLTPRFKVSPDVMLYARIASGFRPGGPNNLRGQTGLPAQFDPDKTLNYEIGAKGDFLDHKLSVDASVYYIDWKNIQLQLLSAQSFAYSANGSGAKSEGVELSVVSKPLTGLTISGWVAYDNAVLTQNFVGCSAATGLCTASNGGSASTAFGVTGDRLPNSPRFSGSLSLEKSFPLWSSVAGFLGATGSFVGDEVGVFQKGPVRQTFPSYTKTDLRAGVRGDSWTVSFYVNNATDARPLLNGGIGYIEPNAYVYLTPRTVGLSVSRRF